MSPIRCHGSRTRAPDNTVLTPVQYTPNRKYLQGKKTVARYRQNENSWVGHRPLRRVSVRLVATGAIPIRACGKTDLRLSTLSRARVCYIKNVETDNVGFGYMERHDCTATIIEHLANDEKIVLHRTFLVAKCYGLWYSI